MKIFGKKVESDRHTLGGKKKRLSVKRHWRKSKRKKGGKTGGEGSG